MTNTRITDAEILETRHPVRVRRFERRRGSGGAGRFRGGDGLIREYEFRAPVTVSLLSERRTRAPYGMDGGEDGAVGRNTVLFSDGEPVDVGGKCQVEVGIGDRLRIETPGGGGWGEG
jgi:5-oxoprolinase (ATP-hydrolysing)